MKYLPWALLGRRTAFNKDLGTSSSELTLGTHIAVPGCILPEIGSEEPSIENILRKLEMKNNRVAIPTSTNPQKHSDPPSDKVSHVYARQHDVKGLHEKYKGPFRILTRPNRTTVEIRAGLTKSGEVRSELRSWTDCKPANLRDGVADAERPQRGRPPKPSLVPSSNTRSAENSLPIDTSVPPPNLPNSNDGGNPSRPTRSTRNPAPNYVDALVASIDFSRPPPIYPPSTTWTASRQELDVINRSIRGC